MFLSDILPDNISLVDIKVLLFWLFSLLAFGCGNPKRFVHQEMLKIYKNGTSPHTLP